MLYSKIEIQITALAFTTHTKTSPKRYAFIWSKVFFKETPRTFRQKGHNTLSSSDLYNTTVVVQMSIGQMNHNLRNENAPERTHVVHRL